MRDWGERAYIHVYRRGLASRFLDQLASHPGNWKNVLITYYSSYEDSSGIKSSTSNDFSHAFNRVALVGELKTPSLPPSVHIPSIKPSQSLIPSRDEVFKEIKDVGEDVSISSLYLFQEDMDLPPLSFNASPEEKWDEEEEAEDIETLLKVVPPAYHQYLDAFSKLKAEKLLPHHACYHHSKLEGLLHPVNDSAQHPIEFDSGKPLPAELNYEIYDKELLGIVWALKRWRAFLISLSDSFEVLKDPSCLQYFMSFKVLTCGQARWAEFLSEFHFSIT
ncbi:hypothetical protein O181_029524 [Austropuccinia psidii MF-1]|uniref:Reverse transcriptase RNase H-like domain-containing protein n=1 Tax=Austropuccinia psidii MF-1 TaxID=1389203 RepID=A0A9Q3CR17_9BASI|nr:hypothetical protein [Austropuccinia psidii MF-1]